MLIMETLLEAARTRLVATGFAGGNVVAHRDPPTVNEALPLASITYEHDSADADGDPRTGTSDFAHKLTLVIDVLDTGATGAAVMTNLAQHGQHAMQALCVDPWNWSENVVEGIGGVRQITDKSPEGAQIVYRRQVQIDVLYRSQWEPSTEGLYDFSAIGVDTGLGADDEGDGSIGADIPVPTTT
ncbi:MAG: hypothetical protein AB7S70_00560 [Hyphomicrobium sp.]|uniref:hypothetical protein n=1 Tax=Hyphomicrobium sp. TaxID=82 RepID=UPI003D1258FD